MLGAITRQLNRDIGSGAQLDRLRIEGSVTDVDSTPAPRVVSTLDKSADLEDRVCAYQHANCGHCHRKGAAADQSGLYLD